MKSFILSAFFLFSLSACTVYRSEGRKQFEAEATAQGPAQAFQLISCKNEGKLETWFQEEFPAHTYELILAAPDLEIWRRPHGRTIEVRAIQKTDKGTQACLYQFANDSIWNLYKNQFINELENNLMTLE